MYEIDFPPVGEATRDGDAITMRYGHGDDYVVGGVDAGFTDDGDAVVEHITRWFDTGSVDFVISTQPDDDHIFSAPCSNGFGWELAGASAGEFRLRQRRNRRRLIALAERQGARVIEPFTGVRGFEGTLLVAGPTKER